LSIFALLVVSTIAKDDTKKDKRGIYGEGLGLGSAGLSSGYGLGGLSTAGLSGYNLGGLSTAGLSGYNLGGLSTAGLSGYGLGGLSTAGLSGLGGLSSAGYGLGALSTGSIGVAHSSAPVQISENRHTPITRKFAVPIVKVSSIWRSV